MYYQYCDECQCYEYDCHGIGDCLVTRAGYLTPRQRYDERNCSDDSCTIGACERKNNE